MPFWKGGDEVVFGTIYCFRSKVNEFESCGPRSLTSCELEECGGRSNERGRAGADDGERSRTDLSL